MTLVKYGLTDLYKGKKIYSNIKLKVAKKYDKQIVYLTKDMLKNIFELIKTGKFEMRNSTVLIQEAHNYIDSRTSMTPKNRTFSYWILQSRHTGFGSCDILFDTQELGQVDKRLRNNTDFILQPVIISKIGEVPEKIGVIGNGKIGQKWTKFYEEYYCKNIMSHYDTHELVDF